MADSGFAHDLSSDDLIGRARNGERTAISALFARHVPLLRRWAHGRLPRWARAFGDTADLVQDALLNTFRRFDRFEPRGQRALQGYLRRTVQNRIADILRRSETRMRADDAGEEILMAEPDTAPSPLDQTISAFDQERYRAALSRLRHDDRVLVVSRLELGYSYDQLALVTGRNSPEAARVALRRAVARLVDEMRRE